MAPEGAKVLRCAHSTQGVEEGLNLLVTDLDREVWSWRFEATRDLFGQPRGVVRTAGLAVAGDIDRDAQLRTNFVVVQLWLDQCQLSCVLDGGIEIEWNVVRVGREG